MTTSTFASRILVLCSVVRRRRFPTQAKEGWNGWKRSQVSKTRPGAPGVHLSSRPVSLSSRPQRTSVIPTEVRSLLRTNAVEGPAFSVLSFASGLLLAVFILAAVSAHATTHTVTDLTDNANDPGSIRYAVNNAASGDTIVFSSTLNGGTILLNPNNGALILTQSATITGPGANLLTISGGSTGSNSYSGVTIFVVNSGVTASISGLTIADGNASGGPAALGNGGGIFIYNGGTLTVSNSTISGNTTGGGGSGDQGGGIWSAGTLTVSNSTISGNTASYGGGIFSGGGTLTVSNSTISGNTASLGGGIFSGSGGGGTLTVSNSTISGNTLTSNSNGGGIYIGSGTATITNSIVAGNTEGQAGTDCVSCGTQSSNNLITTPTNIIDPKLGTLANNGGPTETMLPQAGSPAIATGLSSTLSTDQRGLPRPTGNDIGSDLGAVETTPLTVTTTADTTNSGTSCDGSDTCSLRDALTLANSNGGNDIEFATGLKGIITLSSALPAIAANTNIVGPGANLLTVSGNKSATVGSVFVVNSGVTADLSGLTIANGNGGSGNGGGGVVNSGTLTVSNSAFSGNSAGSGLGLGLGGGIYSSGGTLTVSNSTFSGNTANGSENGGGGIFNSNGVTLTVSNSTFSGNTAGYGGGIYSCGTLTMSNSTFSGNTAGVVGGGIYNAPGSGVVMTLTNSIVAGNTESASGQAGEDCYACTLSGKNLISTSAAPITAAQLMLGPLAYNGPNQTVQTLLPLPGSPAIQAGVSSTLSTDQRGDPRPTGNGVVSDLGAVQTNYTAVQFVQQPVDTLLNVTLAPVTLSVIESGAAALNIPVPLTLTGNGTLSGTTTATTMPNANGVAVATYSNLSVNAPDTSDTLDVYLPITATGSLMLSATSNSFAIEGTPTITWSPTPPTSVVYGAAPITLNATSSVTGPTISYVVDTGPGVISGNTLSFTGAGTVVIEAVSTASNGYASGSVVAYITVAPAALTVSANSATRVYGAANPTFTGTITGAVNGDSFTESFSTTATASSNAGSYAITPTAVGAHLSGYMVTTTDGTLTVTPAATTTTLASSTTSATAGSSVTLTATVKAGSAAVTSGLVLFSSGTTSMGAEPLNSSGVATLTTTNLPVGSDTITASFVASGNDAASTSNMVSVAVSAVVPMPPAATTTTLASSTTSATAGSSVTLTATVKAGSAAVTSGLVLFSSGTTSIGAEPLSASGVATLTTTNLPVGSDTITASFVASGNDAASTSAAVMVTVSALTTPPTPSYTLTATPASLSITPGQTGSASLTITPSGGYSGKLTLVCAGLPANASCTFTQSGTTNNIVTLSGNNTAVNVTLNIQTNVATARLGALPAIRPTPSSPFGPQSPLSPILPALAFWWPGSMAGLAAFGRRKNLSKTRQRMVQLCLLVLMTGALAAGISGCGGSAASTPAAASVTPAGTSNVIVTAAPASGTIQATTITVTIT